MGAQKAQLRGRQSHLPWQNPNSIAVSSIARSDQIHPGVNATQPLRGVSKGLTEISMPKEGRPNYRDNDKLDFVSVLPRQMSRLQELIRMSKAKDEYEFVELNRTFHELSRSVGESDDIDVLRALRVRKGITWASLTREFRVIVLSEAGTGKTKEMRHVAKTLREEGKAAFFLRLEHIPNDFEVAFEVGGFEEFQAWLASGSEGWLFLDSVDEARLRHPRDFELAIRKVGRRVTAAQQRVHIIITGRTSAWRPKTDLDLCISLLPYEPSSVTVASVGDQFEEKGPDRDFHTEEQPESRTHSPFKIVALDDLDSPRIATFASAKGITNANTFLDAVERADAWSFTARPQDLQDLVEFWNDHGSIGGRSEIIQNSIARRLSERDQGRADASPLSPKRAREGAMLLAAAVTMAKESTIRVPDGADNSKGLPVADILPDWNDKDRATLLSRPIFDEAIYGTVRFHHRSVREFLTAEWLAELLRRETSRRKIETLLFRYQYGLDVVVPTMRPILPWLAIRDDKIRERSRQLAPDVLLDGGDPSKLPLDTRRSILRQVCEQIASSASSRTLADYAAVQRFANEDLVADVKELITRFVANDNVAFFLLRMVWLGELKDALSEAMAFALSASSSKYTRTAAFRAVRAVGSMEDMEDIRASFLCESPELNGDCLAELLEGLEPTAHTASWLLACLAKTKEKRAPSVNGLASAVSAFIQRAPDELLPQIVCGLSRLLDTPPLLEGRYCEISQPFGWLMRAAALVTERLIETRNPASLGTDSLAILHKFPISQRRNTGEYDDTKFRFSTLVPAWPELNRASFWYEVGKARQKLDKKGGERLTEYWQVSYGSFWRFEGSDFEYALGQIAERTLPDERSLALSLAFRLYLISGRDRKQRYRLKKAVADDSVLAECLAKYLKPPAQGRQTWNQSEARWRRRAEAMEREEARNREELRTFLRKNADKLRNNGLKPGQVSDHQYYVHQRAEEKNERSGRWTNGSWKRLTEEFGEEVAQAYRDGVIRFWREYRPTLRSEGAPANTTPFAVIFGLAGLEIEANETPDWPLRLNATEIELACRYASYELNGFPTWFHSLFEAYPVVARAFLVNEIRYELSMEKAGVQSHYILCDVSWSGQWAWNELAPELYTILKTKEPENLSNLGYLLNIVQGASMADVDIAKLALRKSMVLKQLDHAAHWFAVWVGVDPDSAIPVLASRFDMIAESKDRTEFAMRFVTHLLGGHHGDSSKVRTAFHAPQHLKSLYLLMHQHIRAKEDIERAGMGTYSPELRDEAQDARNSLAELLRNTPGKEAFIALMDIATAHPDESYRYWFALRAKAKAEMDADIRAWPPHQIRDFYDKLERTPENHRDLAELVHLRLLDLKDDLENGDSSIARIMQNVAIETDMRRFIGRELREKAFGRYSIPQEEELADAKKPDLRFHGTNFDGPVPCELKLADNWTGPDLFERMENQLCGDYLRDNRSSHGFFILVYRGKKKSWRIPGGAKSAHFDGLVIALEEHWKKIALNYPRVDHIDVIGIDLTKRSS
jgi:hypothetical protein